MAAVDSQSVGRSVFRYLSSVERQHARLGVHFSPVAAAAALVARRGRLLLTNSRQSSPLATVAFCSPLSPSARHCLLATRCHHASLARRDGDCKEMVVAARRLWRRRGDGGGGDGSGDDDDGDLEGVGEDDGEDFNNVS